ncbi:M56 family metallopeptidase [Neolewinella persica]|uniref:M56 family metallopeptidase n=1 Tax=Neolewinella persica TaxID=70998 RepID=UPI00037C9E62|nr:M56 family metallopeptidase [Neolewinella persica]
MSTLLTASILLLLLWPAYAVLLRYSDRYALNRFLLVLAMVAVCALPFVSLESPAPAITQSLQGTIEYVEQTTYQSPTVVPNEEMLTVSTDLAKPDSIVERSVERGEITTFIYLGGVGLLLLLLGVRLLFLLSLHLRSRQSSNGQYRLLHDGVTSGQAFTFGKFLYFSADVVSGPDFDHVLAHERVHARQGHSLDIFLSELFLCIFWFHPTAWWLRAKMRANLEFLVDNAVISAGADRRDYQLALVRQSQATHGLALTLPFSEPSLKSRITRMTGMSEYRIISLIATVALLFWLGVAAMVVKGSEAETKYNTFQFDDVTLKGQSSPISATEFLYTTYFTESIPEEINSFELYFRRLPTPDEYLQIKSILQRIPHTNFSIYEPCNGAPGTYLMQLSHYLKQEAVFRNPLREGDLLPHHFLFSLTKRITTQPIPADLPLESFGYYNPAVVSTAFEIKETDNGMEYFDGVRTLPVTNGSPAEGKQYYAQTATAELAEEELAVFINGERFNLLPKPEVKFEDGMQFAGYAAKNMWMGVEGNATDPNALPSSLGQMPVRTVMPPNARMACLLGMEGSPKGMVRRIVDLGLRSPGDYARAFVESMAKVNYMANAPVDRTEVYLNDELISLTRLSEMDFPEGTFVQTGWNENVNNGPYVIQVITD